MFLKSEVTDKIDILKALIVDFADMATRDMQKIVENLQTAQRAHVEKINSITSRRDELDEEEADAKDLMKAAQDEAILGIIAICQAMGTQPSEKVIPLKMKMEDVLGGIAARSSA